MMWTSYLKYLVKRSNEYHIHSPFVFELYTKVIRGHQREKLRELGIERALSMPVGEVLEAYLAHREEATMLVAKDIHQNKKNEDDWNTICGHPDVTLTIDLYCEGLVFYREGMEKQDFVLRS